MLISRLTVLGTLLGSISGFIYSYILVKLLVDNIKYFYFLIHLPTTVAVFFISLVTGMQEGVFGLYVVVAPIIGACEGYFLAFLIETIKKNGVLSNKSAYLIIIALFLLNVVPVNLSLKSYNQNYTNKYIIEPKLISFDTYKIEFLRIEQEANPDLLKIFLSPYENKDGRFIDLIEIKSLNTEVYKNGQKVNLVISTHFNGDNVISFPTIEAPFVLKLKEIRFYSNVKQKMINAELNREVIVKKEGKSP
ncbi:MAG: hypothetical protein ACYC21_14850 [Eubacteriales bacterium]